MSFCCDFCGHVSDICVVIVDMIVAVIVVIVSVIFAVIFSVNVAVNFSVIVVAIVAVIVVSASRQFRFPCEFQCKHIYMIKAFKKEKSADTCHYPNGDILKKMNTALTA